MCSSRSRWLIFGKSPYYNVPFPDELKNFIEFIKLLDKSQAKKMISTLNNWNRNETERKRVNGSHLMPVDEQTHRSLLRKHTWLMMLKCKSVGELNEVDWIVISVLKPLPFHRCYLLPFHSPLYILNNRHKYCLCFSSIRRLLYNW